MSLENMKTPDKAYAKTKVMVLRLIQQKLSAGEDRLPSGEEMARMCGVSLVLIRDVLGELESRGYVSRRRGKGILINDHICRLGPRIDEQVDFMDLIRLHGMEPSVRLTDERWVDCEAAEGLAQGSTLKTCGEPLLRLERVFCGDGKPVLYSLAYYRKSNFKFDYQKWKDFEDLSLCEFLEIFCLRQANTTVAELDFCQVHGAVAQKLELAPGSTLFRMGDIRYALEGDELVSGHVLFHHAFLPLRLYRRSQ